MVDQRIDIVVQDKVAKTIVKRISDIGKASRESHKDIQLLKNELKSLNNAGLNELRAASNKTAATLTKQTESLNKVSISNNKVAISANNVTTSLHRQTAALNSAAASELRAEKAALGLDREVKRLSLDNQKLATETQRTAIATANAANANSRAIASKNRATISTIKLAQAEQKLETRTKATSLSMFTFLRVVAGFTTLFFLSQRILAVADSYTILQNKLKNVTDTEVQLENITKRVFDIANRTRTPVDATAQAFQRFDLALQQLGASQTESLRLTETVNKQLILSGAATSEQRSALLQLSQAFNKGKLDGDEFRSVMELMPPVADAIAKELKVTRGELLNLAPEGKITAEVMRKALASVADEVDEKFAKTTPTIGHAITVWKNKATQFFGEINKNYGITNKFASLILTLANNMDILTVGFVALTSTLIVGFAPAIFKSIAGIGTFFTALAANPIGLAVVGLTTLVGLLAVFKDDIKVSADGVVTFGDAFSATIDVISDRIEPVTSFFKTAWNSAFNNLSEQNSKVTENFANEWETVNETAVNGITNTYLISSNETSKFETFFKKVFNAIGAYIKFVINFWVRNFVASYNIIKRVWNGFPTSLKDMLATAGNFVLEGVENIANNMIKGLGYIIKFANELRAKLGKEPIEMDFELKLPRFKSGKQNPGGDLANIVKEEFQDAWNTDFAGDLYGDIKKRSREIANSKNEIENQDNLRKPFKVPSVNNTNNSRKKDNEIKLPTENYSQAIAKVNRGINTQIRMTQYLGKEQQIQSKFQSIENNLLNRKIMLLPHERKELLAKIRLLENEKVIQSEMNTLYDKYIGTSEKLQTRLIAINRLQENGTISTEQYKNEILALTLEVANLNLELGKASSSDFWISSIGQLVDNFEGVLPALSDSFGNFFNTLNNGFADSIGRAIVMGDDLSDSLKNVAQNAMAQLISSIIKMGAQWVITQALMHNYASSSRARQLAESVAVAKAEAAAWSTPAAFTSLSSFGANAAPASVGIASTVALSKGIAAFKTGGYTGNGGTDDIAGFVHGGEFVLDAATTERIGVNNLEALQNGLARVQQPNQTNNYNYGSKEPVVHNHTRIINVDDPDKIPEYLQSSDGEEIIINHVKNNLERIF